MKPSIIVHGPQGCGKTRNAEVLRAHFGLDEVRDGFEPRDGSHAPLYGVLLLTNCAPPIYARPITRHVKWVAYADLVKEGIVS